MKELNNQKEVMEALLSGSKITEEVWEDKNCYYYLDTSGTVLTQNGTPVKFFDVTHRFYIYEPSKKKKYYRKKWIKNVLDESVRTDMFWYPSKKRFDEMYDTSLHSGGEWEELEIEEC
jgi:hypothetical protein